MPIKIPSELPAYSVLEGENIFVMSDTRAQHQDIRPLRLLILNLMPTKVETETQLLRCLSNTPLQIEIDFMQTATYRPTHIAQEHLQAFYKTFDEVRNSRYDGFIITGAPVELMDFERVAYWDELCEIMEWAKTHVFSTLHICWGAQAGLYYHYGVEKHKIDTKLFGIFEHEVLVPHHRLFRGFDRVFRVPHSRYTEVREADVRKCAGLEVLSTSGSAGLHICASADGRKIFMTGHPEYDADTLLKEYRRDVDKGIDVPVPTCYFEDDDPQKPPVVSWRSHATLLYTNWLNYFVYQETPYDFVKIPENTRT